MNTLQYLLDDQNLPSGAIWDCDGTLIDNMPVHYDSYVAALDPLGVVFEESKFYELAGVPIFDVIKIVCQEQNKTIDIAAAVAAKHQIYNELKQTGLDPVKPALQLVAKYHKLGIPQGVVSGSGVESVSHSLELFVSHLEGNLSVQDVFTSIVCAEHVTDPKPHPEGFLKAASNINIAPELCYGFEDGKHGITAIESANMKLAVNITTLDGYR
eukprot:TRINITY_DN8107_c0_g1_i2.p1 TRINITY_DN8107_c0_g1~~TRINITY_DN8107_c0_g1_i2.p1  ORF type:complete len:213 (-),score=41.70 TRINITY_DN8107_c0_g1_i2:68-706(-)